MRKLPISCYIRTLNEARMIARVVAAAKEVVDEVVVIDSGSTDDTVALAEAAGARVVRQAWLGNGRQKRFGEDQCVHDWVLDLDADEIVTAEFAAELRAIFAGGAPKYPVYQTMLVTAPPVGEPWWDFGLAPRRKLYDKTRIRAPDHEAWDQFELPRGMAQGRIRAALLHHSFTDLAQLAAKLNSWSTLGARGARLKPLWQLALRLVLGPPFYFLRFYLGRSLWRGGLYGFAVAAMSAHGRWLRDAKMLEIHLRRAEERRDTGARRKPGGRNRDPA